MSKHLEKVYSQQFQLLNYINDFSAMSKQEKQAGLESFIQNLTGGLTSNLSNLQIKN